MIKNNSYKTAVEWFANRLIERGLDYSIEDFEQAKEMEKQQKRTEYMRGWKDGYSCKSIKNKIQ
jgi:hypothetical protein